MPELEFKIRLAIDEVDNKLVDETFNRYFLQDEPINRYLNVEKYREDTSQSLRNNGLTFIAEVADSAGGRQLAGFLMCEICGMNDSIDPENFPLRTDNQTGHHIFRLVSELNRNCDIFERFQVNEVFEMFILCVSSEFRGKSIGRRLCQEALRFAKSKGYRVAFVDCSSAFTAAIAEKLDMRCVSEVSYAEYRDENGSKIFRVKEPHTHLRRFVKVLGE